MRRLIVLNLRELLDRKLCRDEASGSEVRSLELLKRLRVELRLELLKDIRKLYRPL